MFIAAIAGIMHVMNRYDMTWYAMVSYDVMVAYAMVWYARKLQDMVCDDML